jgi:hypothetical protein
MPQLALQPTQNDNVVTLLKKFLNAVNFYWGGFTPGQQVNSDGTPISGATTTVAGSVSIVGDAPVVGNVGGFSQVAFLTQTGAAAVYINGDVVGACPSTLTPFRTGKTSAILQSLTVVDKSGVGPALYILIGLPGSFGVAADNAALAAGTYPEGIMAVIPVVADDYISVGTSKVASVGGIGKVLSLYPSFTELVYAVVTNGGFTASVANGIRVNFGLLQD